MGLEPAELPDTNGQVRCTLCPGRANCGAGVIIQQLAEGVRNAYVCDWIVRRRSSYASSGNAKGGNARRAPIESTYASVAHGGGDGPAANLAWVSIGKLGARAGINVESVTLLWAWCERRCT